MPIPVSYWNFTHRDAGSSYNDHYRGKQNAVYTLRTEKPNQGDAASKCMFPQGSFHSCRYSTHSNLQRSSLNNTWHPFSILPSSPNSWLPTAQALIPRFHNTTNSKALPPHCTNPNLPPPMLPKVEGKKRRKEQPPPLKAPSHKDHHTLYSGKHEKTKIKPFEIFRQSKKVEELPLD